MTDHRIYELRRYRLKRAGRAALIDVFEREFIETQEAVGMELHGLYTDLDDPDAFIWFRSFANMDERAQALDAFYTGPVWKAHGAAANATMLNSDNVLLLKAATEQTPFADGSKQSGGGLVTVSIASLAPNTATAFAEFFEQEVAPELTKHGARVDATFVTETSANSFPRLPVREGETVFVWVSSFPNADAYAAHRAALERASPWSDDIFPKLDAQLWQPLTTVRLVPTARSSHGW